MCVVKREIQHELKPVLYWPAERMGGGGGGGGGLSF